MNLETKQHTVLFNLARGVSNDCHKSSEDGCLCYECRPEIYDEKKQSIVWLYFQVREVLKDGFSKEEILNTVNEAISA